MKGNICFRICVIWLPFILSCTALKTNHQPVKISQLRFLGEYDIPYNFQFKRTTVGGLSGIDYDIKKKQYYLICDDRSDINSARFYTAKLAIKNYRISKVRFTNVTTLLNESKKPYPSAAKDMYHTIDPEAVRYFPLKKKLLLSSEGERIVNNNKEVLQDPFLHWIKPDGTFIDSFCLPKQMHSYSIQKGIRQNGVFEGVDFADNFKLLYTSLEEPLYEDGSRASINDSAWVRIIKFDVTTRQPLAQYAYQVDPVAYSPTEAGAFSINGVSDILSLGENKFLLIERSYSKGRTGNTIKLYLADLNAATDVQHYSSILDTSFQPVDKKLLLNMDSLGRHIDNVEGVCFGPTLKDGNRTLVFVTDNNFDKAQKTQFLLFEVMPD